MMFRWVEMWICQEKEKKVCLLLYLKKEKTLKVEFVYLFNLEKYEL